MRSLRWLNRSRLLYNSTRTPLATSPLTTSPNP
jgi:hypothetical protein